jgi:hypothetical protein
MTTIHLVPEDIRKLYEVHEWRNATGVLKTAHPNEWEDILDVLRAFRLYHEDVLARGGNKSIHARRIDSLFYSRGWEEKEFKTAIKVDDQTIESPTHKVDCYKGKVALETEWNNKDPFFDRDLNNFRLLFELRAVDVGVIITRCAELQTLFKSLGGGARKGASTTHIGKLLPKIEGGGGGGCPVLAFGITESLYTNEAAPPLLVSGSDDDEDDE